MKTSTPVEGYVTYVTDCPKPVFPLVEVPWDVEFPRVALESRTEGTLTIQIVCSVSQDIDRTLLRTESVVDRITRELAFRFSCSIGTPIRREFNIPYADSQGHLKRRVSGSVTLRWGGSAQENWSPGVSGVTEVIAAARDLWNPQRSSDLELYRSSLMANDPVARFVLLYAALQQIVGAGNQHDVDDWIRKHATTPAREVPSLRLSSKRTKSISTETEFTSIRNSLDHVRSGQTSFAQSLDMARRLLVQLQDLTALAISLKYSASP